MYDPYSFSSFITKIQTCDSLTDMIVRITLEIQNVQRISYINPGAKKAREMGSESYIKKLEQLSFWLQQQIKPQGVTDHDFQQYKFIAEKLIKNGELPESVLDMFS